MRTVRVNFTVPEEIIDKLKSRIEKRSRSAFVTEAIRGKLKELEEEQLKQALIEGYQAQNTEDTEMNRDWEESTLEKWGE